MANFPGGVGVQYPVGRRVSCPARGVEFLDGSEQRWRAGGVLGGVTLQLTNVPDAELDLAQAWVASVRGAWDSSWSLGLGSETVTGLALESDELAATETSPGRWSIALAMRQTVPAVAGAVAAAYPLMSTGNVTQRPWSERLRYLTTRNDMASGPRYAWYERATGRRAWSLGYPSIPVADAVALAAFFAARGGRVESFTFPDPRTGTVYTCRFDQDELVVQYAGPGECSTAVEIVEVAA